MSLQFTPRHSRKRPRFPNQIRAYRLRAGLTQRVLGESVGMAKNTISAWERGLTCPTTPPLLRLAKSLDTLAEALYPEFYVPRREDNAARPVA
jgi:transcriptional regulator with XRE-family HTH domain